MTIMTSNNFNVKVKEREFLIECIELYRDLPALWQEKNKLYQLRDKKNMAYDILLAKYKKMYPEATKEDLKGKFNSLRTNYRKERKRHVNSLKSGTSTDSIYVPTLWYYKEMNFLRDRDLPGDSESSMDTHITASADGVEDNEEQKPETRASIAESQNSKLDETPPLTTFQGRKKTKKNEELINLANERLCEVKDEYYHWAFAADLRKMERTQQIYAKKAIAEIIMEGQLGQLHRHSIEINENTHLSSLVQLGASPSPQYYSDTPSPSYSNPTTPTSSPPVQCVNPSSVKITAKRAAPSPDISVSSIPSPS